MKTNCKKAIENTRKYVVEHTTLDPNCVDEKYTRSIELLNKKDDKIDKFSVAAHLIMATFYDEYYLSFPRFTTKQDAFECWCSGLPSVLDTCYYYNRSAVDDLGNILEQPKQERNKYSEREAEKILTRLIYREISKVVK